MAESWKKRFPALARLGLPSRRRQRIPFIPQLAATECGTACLAMVLAHFGKPMRIEELREVITAGRDGLTVRAIIDAARRFGLRGRGVQVAAADIGYLPPGAILRSSGQHFVVLERVRRTRIDVLDPTGGRRRIARAELEEWWSGIAITFEPDETFVPARRPPRGLARYVKEILSHRELWIRILLMSVLVQVFGLAIPVLMGALIDQVIPRGDYQLLTILGLGFLSLTLFQMLSSLVRARLLLHLRTVLDSRMTLGFLEHLVRLPYAFFQRRKAGDLMSRLTSNSTVREILTSSALSGLLDGAMVSIYLVIFFSYSPKMAALVLALGTLHVAVLIVTRRRQKELMAETLQIQARSQSYQVEMLTGMETLKAMGCEGQAVDRWSNLFVDELNVSLRRGALDAGIEAVVSMLRLGSPMLILGIGTLQVLAGKLSLGTMLGLNALAGGFLGPLASLVGTAMRLQLLGGYLDRINDVLDSAVEQERDAGRKPGSLTGDIRLDRVEFRYAPDAPLVIRDVSLSIQSGEFVAIVGPSGSGKSTLAGLLLGLYRPTNGRILYDGSDLAQLDLGTVRRQLGIVTQAPYLFGSSVRANIALSDPDTALEDIIAAAKKAHIHHEIAAMPMGYDTLLVDRGASLSGGQRQRVAIARALVRQPSILLLDEATSNLDAITEARIQDELAALNCTRIVIAHRLSTIARADQILVIEDGVLVEHGRHEELLQKRGAYFRLVMAQIPIAKTPAADWRVSASEERS